MATHIKQPSTLVDDLDQNKQIYYNGLHNGIVPHHQATPYDVIVIGAGFSGIGVGYKLKQAGICNFLILESASEVGGTWYHNSYPGCACDIPSLVYSYSFKQSAKWSEYYPKQPEILQYMKDCVLDLNLTPYVRLDHKVSKTSFDADTGLWTTHIHNQEPVRSHIVMPCTGHLDWPLIPNFPGRDTFQGAQWHTARWNHNYDLKGKRIGIIGTGQSAIQIVKPMSDVASHLTVFQRSPSHIIPRHNAPVPRILRLLFTHFPLLMAFVRGVRYWLLETTTLVMFEWQPWSAVLQGKIKHHRQTHVPNEKLRDAITPDFPPGCKRVGINDDYYPSLTRPNVTLVPRAAVRVTPGGVVDAGDVEHELDVIVYATGFAAGDKQLSYEIIGLGGASLEEVWAAGDATAYYGGCMSGFPNLYMVHGPNTSIGNNSAIHMIESQTVYAVDYTKGVLRLVRAGIRNACVDVVEKAQLAYNDVLLRNFKGSVFIGPCTSWYRNKNNRNVITFPDGTHNFRKLFARAVGWEDFTVSPPLAQESKEWQEMKRNRGVRDMQKVISWGWLVLMCVVGLLAIPAGLFLAVEKVIALIARATK